MKITSAEFIKSVVGTEEVLENPEIPQVTFIGRSNVGKSSTINALLKQKLARVSSTPGRTQTLNVYLVNKRFYLVDVPGYGYAKVSKEDREWLGKLINWYLFKSNYNHKAIVFIIDAYVGPTAKDLEMLQQLQDFDKPIIIVANKVDQLRKSEYTARIEALKQQFAPHLVLPFSAEKNVGVSELGELLTKLLSK